MVKVFSKSVGRSERVLPATPSLSRFVREKFGCSSISPDGDLYGEPTEELSFGFSEESNLNEAVAVLEWKRLNPSNVWFFGRAEGTGSTDAAIEEFLPRNHPESLTYVLECDLDLYTYEIYKKEESGPWLSVGRGAIAEGAEIP